MAASTTTNTEHMVMPKYGHTMYDHTLQDMEENVEWITRTESKDGFGWVTNWLLYVLKFSIYQGALSVIKLF